jgi:hypothetical protein
MFRGGLNAMVGQGEVLLQAYTPAQAIVTGPNAHSQWLDKEEHLVDPRLLQEVQLIARYPIL